MNVKLFAASFAAVCALAACQSNGAANGNMTSGMHNQQQGSYMPAPSNLPDEQFKCRNGSDVTIKYLDADRISLSISTDTSARAVLSRTRAASGELFTAANGLYNKRTDWHQKAGESHFSFRDPYNNLVETSCKKIR